MSSPFVSSATRRPRRRWSYVVLVLLVLASIALAALLAGVAVAARGTIPHGTTVAGTDVGGMTREEALAAITLAARDAASRPIRLIGTGGVASTSGRELGARPLVAPALEQALDTGLVERLLRRAGIGKADRIELFYRLGPVRAAELANRLDRRFGEPARDATVVVGRSSVRIEPPVQGSRIDRRALRRGLRTLPAELGLAVETEPPRIDVVQAQRAARTIERLLAVSRGVRAGTVQASLPAAVLRPLVTTTAEDGRLVVGLRSEGLRKALLPKLGALERLPRDAAFVVDGAHARLVPSRPGRQLDVERISASLVSNLDALVHRARFTASAPALDTEAARKLRITELVSEFTTNYECCQPRVTNIRRAAEMLDGTLVLPGKEFSLNRALGKRTEAKGFVAAPQIFDGRLEDAVGGGISQVATTLFNAAFFAGVELVAHRAHQFYISRYPMGREATISWGGPELIFRNDWPAGILMKLDAGETGISVRFYSSRLGRRVETVTGRPYDVTAPRTVTIVNQSLPAGSRRVVQEAGGGGFRVDFTRKVFRRGRVIRNESYTVRYDPKNEIIEVGPSASAERPSDGPRTG